MIYLLLGTNLGDREWNLEQAKSLLSQEFRTDMLCSEIMETEAVGFEGPDFLNQIVAFDAPVGCEELLDICQGIEVQMGRPAHEAKFDSSGRRIYHDRIIDIDILFFNDMAVRSDRLVIPHPQVEERPFVGKLLKTFDI